MLFQILRSFKCLSTEVAFVWLKRNMDANVRCYVVTLDGSCPTGSPRTGQAKVIGAFATNVNVAKMVLFSTTRCFRQLQLS